MRHLRAKRVPMLPTGTAENPVLFSGLAKRYWMLPSICSNYRFTEYQYNNFSNRPLRLRKTGCAYRIRWDCGNGEMAQLFRGTGNPCYYQPLLTTLRYADHGNVLPGIPAAFCNGGNGEYFTLMKILLVYEEFTRIAVYCWSSGYSGYWV